MSFIISIIVPVFNGMGYIQRTLENFSKIHLVTDHIEIILIDDGSTDGTRDIIRAGIDLIPNLTIIWQEKNSGVGAARNAGFRAAKGHYIWCVDADDVIEIDKITDVLDYIKFMDPEVLVVGAQWVRSFAEPSSRHEKILIEIYGPRNCSLRGDEYYCRNHSNCYFFMFIVKRDIIVNRSIYFVDRLYMEDFEILPRLLMHVERLFVSDIIIYDYIIRSNSLVYNASPESVLFRLSSMIEVWRHLAQTQQLEECRDFMKETIIKQLQSLEYKIRYAYIDADLGLDVDNDLLKRMKEVGLFPFSHVEQAPLWRCAVRYVIMQFLNLFPINGRHIIRFLHPGIRRRSHPSKFRLT